jgi:predicted dehydrogenase
MDEAESGETMKNDTSGKNKTAIFLSRRQFVAGALAAAAAPRIIPASALGLNDQLAPSERIAIGMLGMGNRGTDSWNSMKPLPDHQVVAVADCRRDRALLAQKNVNDFYAGRVGKQQFKGCDIYNDFRELLAHKDIDAVWGCVPDHWHGVVYSRAIEAGKDIYGEKPITRWIAEGIKVRNAVRRYGCVFQTGTMQRSWRQFPQACELAINGYLGKVHTIRVGAPGGTSYPSEPPCDPPQGFDYDLWTGPAPYIPFDKKRCEWLAMYMISHYCAGFITNWGVHYLDIAGWGCPEVFDKPFTVEGTGALPTEGMTDTWISWQMNLRWDSGLKMLYTEIGGASESGCKFIGDQGWVRVDRSGIWAEPASLLTVKLKPSDTVLHHNAGNNDAPGYTSHTADFFRSIRTRQDPVSPVESGQAASTLGNVSDIALRLGRKLKWDPTQDRFLGDDEANQMLSRSARSPWTT